MKITGMTRSLATIALSLAALQTQAQGADLDNESERMSYSIGVNIAENLGQQGLTAEIDVDAFIAGLRDGIDGNVQLSQEQIMTALNAFQQQMMDRQQMAAEQARSEGEAFLAENAQREEVMTTDSGLQYMVLEAGDGTGESPAASDSVLAHYEGRLIDGEVFDSSIERGEPAEFALNQVISGWTEGLQLMTTGDRYRFFIPAELGYGEGGGGPIPPNATLIFDVELLEVNP